MNTSNTLPAVSCDENRPLFGVQSRLPLRKDSRPYVRWPANFCHLTWFTFAASYVNLLLVFVPLGIVAGARSWKPTTVFILNFLAIIPLAALLTFASEELSARLSQTWRGLLNAIFVNAVKLCVSIIALWANQIRVVQSCMLGSILSNILLVLGLCFVAGGIKHHESTFNTIVASTMSSLMVVASVSLIIPATVYTTLPDSKSAVEYDIIVLSRGTAMMLLALYVVYLYFQLKSHASFFNEMQRAEEDVEERRQGQILPPIAAAIALAIVIAFVAICATFLVRTIDPIVETTQTSKTFIGLVLLPILGNGTERVTAIIVAYRGRMDLAINIVIGSSIQIALFITPFLVILSWCMHTPEPMTLFFQDFETICLFLSVLVVKSLIDDGKSNYLEGAMCLGTYIIIVLAFRLMPDP